MARTLRRWSLLALLTAAALGLAGLTAAPTSSAADSAKVYVVQGLPGRDVDVAIDGKTVAKGIGTAKVAGPVSLPGGRRTVRFSEGDEVLLEKSFDVKAGSSWDVVVHLPGDQGDPDITVFRNDLSAVPRGTGNLTVAHTARVGHADIRVNGKVAFADIKNGQSLSAPVPVATYKVAIVPAGKTEPVVLGPVSLTVKGGALNRVYAIGDPSEKTMNVAVHVIDVATRGSGRPERVNTGTGGQAAGLVPSGPNLWN